MDGDEYDHYQFFVVVGFFCVFVLYFEGFLWGGVLRFNVFIVICTFKEKEIGFTHNTHNNSRRKN